MKTAKYVASFILGGSLFMHAPIQAADEDVSVKADVAEDVFVRVNDSVISLDTYNGALRAGGRQRFYHGKAPEAELVAFRKEIANLLIDERLLLQEARRRGMQVDDAWVQAEFEKIESRYAARPGMAIEGEEMRRQVVDSLGERNLIERLQEELRKSPEPTEAELQAYYEANADKFTSPEQVKVSTILVSVTPWSPSSAWKAAEAEAALVLNELKQGASFEEYMEQYPLTDARKMGYLHRGMLGEEAEVAIDKIQQGDITDVVVVLEGVAIFRLDERIAPRLNPLERVRSRAVGLWKRENSEKVYREALDALRKKSHIVFEIPEYYLPRAQRGKGGESVSDAN